MTPEERVRAGGVVLVFDAPNVSTTQIFALAKAAVDRGKALRLLVPVTAHTEKLTHLRRALGARYDATMVRKALEDAGVEIMPLDVEAANAVAEHICARFSTDEAWQDAKWHRVHGDTPRGASNKPPATIDWYTAALCPPGAIVVTDDMGVEYHGCQTMKSAALATVLRELST
jgi:hypothetical protein